MRRTNLRGHALRAEGRAFRKSLTDPTGPWRDAVYDLPGDRWRGSGLCECGAASPELNSNSQRKAWHAEHKNEVRAKAGDGQ